MSDPTLDDVRNERDAQREMIRITAKRRALVGLAQSLEALDAELAASKAIRKELKAHESALKLTKLGVDAIADDTSITAEAILNYHEQVKKLLRDAPLRKEFDQRRINNAFENETMLFSKTALIRDIGIADAAAIGARVTRAV